MLTPVDDHVTLLVPLGGEKLAPPAWTPVEVSGVWEVAAGERGRAPPGW
jgi:hypothetical protein